MLSGELWPAHPKPLPDELLSCWYIRTALANGRKLLSFTELAGSRAGLWWRDVDLSLRQELLETLARRTGTPLERAQQTTLADYEGYLYEQYNPAGFSPWILSARVRNYSRRGLGTQYCPECLAEDPVPYFRRRWRLAWVTVCPKHQRLLSETCPCCGVAVAYHRLYVGRNLRLSGDVPMSICYSCGMDMSAGQNHAPKDSSSQRDEWFLRKRVSRPSAEPPNTLPLALKYQVFLERILEQGWFEWEGRPGYSHQYFDVLDGLVRLLQSKGVGEKFRQGIHRLSGLPIPLPERLHRARIIELLPVWERLELMVLAAWVMEDFDWRTVAICQEMRIAFSHLTVFFRRYRDVPFWFAPHLERVQVQLSPGE